MSVHERPVLTVAEVAETLSLCTKSVYTLIARGDLQTLPNLRKKLVPRTSLDAYIESAFV